MMGTTKQMKGLVDATSTHLIPIVFGGGVDGDGVLFLELMKPILIIAMRKSAMEALENLEPKRRLAYRRKKRTQ
jgi:hypothetical protein